MIDICAFLATLSLLLALAFAFDTRSKKKETEWLDAAHTIRRGAVELSKNAGVLSRKKKSRA
jgi:hypothetical protein